jgi:putative FmdB family regulatory protein
MPIYEYECSTCGHQFEYLVLSTSPAATCPSCNGDKLTRLVSLCAVSSEATKAANLKSARKRAKAIRKDMQHEEHKYIHREMSD